MDYEPSDDDVIRARLRTIGVQEYRFIFDKGLLAFLLIRSYEHSHNLVATLAGLDVGHEWLMYDVGGARTLVRHIQTSPLR